MPAPSLRLSEAQQLLDGLADPLLRPAIQVFLNKQKSELIERLLTAVRKPQRDTLKEAQIAGKMEAYEEILPELQRFAEDAMKQASQ